jgi:hypothetical protein
MFMKIKQLLKPEWKKILLPAIFLLLFAYLIINFAGIGAAIDNHAVDTVQFLDVLLAQTQSQNLTFSEILERVNTFFQPLREEIARHTGPEVMTTLNFIRTLDPFLPVPCETTRSPSCRYYIQKPNYELLYSRGIPQLLLAVAAPPELFSHPTPFDYTVNVALLIVEGYLISCIIFFIYRKTRTPWHKRLFTSR